MAGGRMVREGPVSEILWTAEHPAFLLQVLRDPSEAIRVLEGIPGVGAVATVKDGIRFYCEGGAEGASTVLATLVSAGIPVSRLTEEESSLESTFLELARAEEPR
jgi:hypothetical protein